MAKITQAGAPADPFNLPRPEIITEERTFSEPGIPDTQITVTFQCDGDFTLPMKIGRMARGFMQTHGAANGIPIVVGGRKVEITDDRCAFIATIMTLEPSPSTFEFWAAVSVTMPYAMSEIAVWADEILSRETGPKTETDTAGAKVVLAPNDSGVTSESPSELQQNTESTPN